MLRMALSSGLVALQLVAFLASPSHAEAPEIVRFQGVVAQLQGQVPLDGDYSFLVEIFDQATGGAPLYSQTVAAPMAGGAYTVTVSPTVPGDLSAALDGGGSRFIQITVLSGPVGQPVNEVLLPRQQIASVPYALGSNSVPTGGIILWDQSDQCPSGYFEAQEFRGLLVRGADVAGTIAGVPEDAGRDCGASPDAQCDAPTAAYDDSLSSGELAPHNHDGFGHEANNWPYGVSGSPSNLGMPGLQDINNYFYKTSTTGSGDPHYHPFRTVLFCRKN